MLDVNKTLVQSKYIQFRIQNALFLPWGILQNTRGAYDMKKLKIKH